MKNNICKVGVDVGSTTLKVVALDPKGDIIHKVYRRHQAEISDVFTEELEKLHNKFPDKQFTVTMTGSAGMGIAERTEIPFVQEVVSSVKVVAEIFPQTTVLIDLGGEDAKMVFFSEERHPDIRMNGSCAGGTGSFIDQMADLMHIPVEELGELALKYEKTYPVASRCGVFAKTDVQNLLSRGIPLTDLSMSILHTVALQSITSLARGYKIKPTVLCVGGPLTFMPALQDCFREILELNDDELIVPENSLYFPAWGAALECEDDAPAMDLKKFAEKLHTVKHDRKDIVDPLFTSEEEYLEWKRNRKIKPLEIVPLGEKKRLKCFLGVDSGSTTTKILIADDQGDIVYQFYDGNEGNPLKKVIEGLTKFYKEAEEKGVEFEFLASAATGYGEDLVKSALGLDYGIVETMAHLSGAQYVDPNVTFVLDVGGQDMKSIFTRGGVISNIELNEACSSGCGSFLQNFASTMNMTLAEFTEAACRAKQPSDLGSRCTVFMNSKVKQSLRENATFGDIAAGLAYSVVKNCLFKVLKISNLNHLGDHIVVQGGTFRNDAVYRALEMLSGKQVSSTDKPELMGALGAALYAERMYKLNREESSFKGDQPLPDPSTIQTRELQCKGCTNRCSVLRYRFANGNTSYAGNKCEKVFYNPASAPDKGFNAFDTKNKVIFGDYLHGNLNSEKESKKEQQPIISDNRFVSGIELKEIALDGLRPRKKRVGIPRILNMFEHFPFWEALFTECGYEVVLSPETTFPLYQRGVGNVMSDNICFPAKVVHGHIIALSEMNVDRIFYPLVPKDHKEFEGATNSYNCPVVSGYPDVVRSSMDPENSYGIPYDRPVIAFNSNKALENSVGEYLDFLGVDKATAKRALRKAKDARHKMNDELVDSQKALFDKTVKKGDMAFVVAGRPYHADPLINQKVGQILSDLGVNVFTDDVFRAEEGSDFDFDDLKIVSQWSYPNRVVQSALKIAEMPNNVQLIQLNSFGCGPDSFFIDEISEIMRDAGKNLTILRIDEIASPGSIRLRLRSLIESLKAVADIEKVEKGTYHRGNVMGFREEDKNKTILIPWFSDFISPFVPALGKLSGYKFENLPKSNKASSEAGLKYGNNEVCYPSTLVLGDIITTLKSGKYDIDDVVVAITQTGGQCRATNYVAQIKNGLESAGFKDVPVLVLSTGKVFQNEQSAFKLPVIKILNIAIYTLLFADQLQVMYNATITREKNKGDTQKVFDYYIEKGVEALENRDKDRLLELLAEAIKAMNNIELIDRQYDTVGLIGEIYVKYNNYGQAHTTEWLRDKGVEVLTPPILDFVMQYFVNSGINYELGVRKVHPIVKRLLPLMWRYMYRRIDKVEEIMKDFRFYVPAETVFTGAEYASEILSLSNQFGEGWALSAEISHFARNGVNKIVCVQPFGCIANHIIAKGVEKRIKKIYPEVDLLFLDIDGGMAEVNLQNRLHFLV